MDDIAQPKIKIKKETIAQPKIEIKKETTSQPMHQVRQETFLKNHVRDEQGQPIPKLPRMEGVDIPSTSHQSSETPPQCNDGQGVICKLCNQPYKDPRLLDCLHSFCLRCLDKPEVPGILLCPECKEDTIVPPMGVSGLCKDFFTTKLVEEQAIKQELLSQGPRILCQACDEKELAVDRCLDCKEFLCIPCKMAHQRFTKKNPHTLINLEDLRSGKVSLNMLKAKGVYNVQKCRNHVEQDLCRFCITCQDMICLMCTVLNHCKHDFVDIKTAEESCRSKIIEVLTPLEVDAKELQVAKTSAEQAKKKLESNVKKVLDKIVKKKRSELDKLNRRLKVLKDKAEFVAKQRDEELDKCLKVANTNATKNDFILKKVRSMVSDEDCHDIITLKTKILKNLKRVSLKKGVSVPLDLSFMAFAESSTSGNNLGELVLEEVWTLKEDFGKDSIPACNFKWAKAVVACSNGDMVVLDSGNNRVMTLTSKGVHKGTIQSKDPRGIFITPIDIALSTSENILVLDSAVKVFDKEGVFISRLLLPEGITSAKCIDAGSGKIAIGTKKMILLCDEDGSNPSSIPAKLIDTHIAICSKTESLIYTNYEMSRLVSVKFSGRENFNISTAIKANTVKPAGICIDKSGDIYIAVHSGLERGTGEIHHYSPEGSYIGFVAKNLYNPVGLSFSPIGELMVADRPSVKVFQRA